MTAIVTIALALHGTPIGRKRKDRVS